MDKEKLKTSESEKNTAKKPVKEKLKLSEFENESLKRFKKKEKKIVVQKFEKPSVYVKISNKVFHGFSSRLIEKGYFGKLRKNLIKANLQFTPAGYLSVAFLSTIFSIFLGILIVIFFLFFNISSAWPIIIKNTEEFGAQILNVIWVLIAAPVITFFVMYIYPSLERKSIEQKINHELPFVTVHMSAIAGSMVEPSKIFSIIISTKEYPNVEREFIKLINEINVYGYDLVTALKNAAYNSPSKKLSELLNGMAVTITSGGSLAEFFEKRAQTLLFDYKIEREKYTKSAETFMDIYISVVIAAPMILMLLLMMMKISGLGLTLSTGTISLIMVLAVSVVNIIFLTFLHLKQPNE